MSAKFAHKPLHQKLQEELDSAFNHISSDEEPVDERTYDKPFDTLHLSGWAQQDLRRQKNLRLSAHRYGQKNSSSHPFILVGRLAATLKRAKHKFMLLHARARLPQPLPDGWTHLHTVCYIHDFKNFHKVLCAASSNQMVNASLRGKNVDGITPLHLLVRPFYRIRQKLKSEETLKVVEILIEKLLKHKANIDAVVS